MDGNGRARARRRSSSDGSGTGWSDGGERTDLGLPLSFAVTGARAPAPKRARGSAGRRVDGGRPPSRRGSGDALVRDFERELGRAIPPEIDAEAGDLCSIVIDCDEPVAGAADRWGDRWLYRAAEVGELLGCTDRYVKELVRRGDIHAVRIGRLVRIPAAEVEAFVARRLARVDPSARPVLGRPPHRLRSRPPAPTGWDDELPPDLVW